MSHEWTSVGKDDARLYNIPGHKKPMPSVTTVLKSYGDFLWAHLYEIERYVQNLADAHARKDTVEHWVELDGEWRKTLVKPAVLLLDGKHVAYAGLRSLKRSAEMGLLRHLMLEDWSHGVSVHEHEIEEWAMEHSQNEGFGTDVSVAVPSLRQLCRWLWKWTPKIVVSEAKCYHYQLRYAGTFDCIMEIDHPLFKGGIVDVKPDRFERRYIAQLAAYSHATHLYTDDNKRLPMPKGLGAAVLMVGDERAGLRPIERPMLKTYFDKMFRPALQCWHASALPLPPKGKDVWL